MSDLPNEKTIALIDAPFNAVMRRRKVKFRDIYGLTGMQ